MPPTVQVMNPRPAAPTTLNPATVTAVSGGGATVGANNGSMLGIERSDAIQGRVNSAGISSIISGSGGGRIMIGPLLILKDATGKRREVIQIFPNYVNQPV